MRKKEGRGKKGDGEEGKESEGGGERRNVSFYECLR